MMAFDKWMRRAQFGAVTALAVLASACGGGGGGSPEATPQSQNGSPEQLLALTANNADTAAVLGLSLGDLTLALAQVEVTSSQAALIAAESTTTSSCANGGTVQLTWTDMNGDSQRGIGDTITIQYRDCAVAQTGSALTGAVLLSITGKTDKSLNLTVDYGSGLLLVDQSDLSTSHLLGTMNATWSDDGLTRHLAVSSSARDDLRLTAAYQDGSKTIQDTEQLKSLSLQKVLSREHANTLTTLNYQLSSVYLGGTIYISTPTALSSYFDTYPNAGEINVRSMGPAVARLKANFVTNNDMVNYEFDANGDGSADDSGYGSWSNFTTGIIWWGEELGGRNQFTSAAPKLFASGDFHILNAQFKTSAGGQLPVLAIQFSRELAGNLAPRLELLRTSYDYGDPYFWGSARVPVSAQVTGAYVVLTPSEPLQHGLDYVLRAVDANGQPVSAITYKDTLGNTLNDGGRTFTVDSTLSAVITLPHDAPLLSNGKTVTLSATSSKSTKGIVSYHWTGVEGAGLVFSAPDTPTTTVRLNSVGADKTSATVQLQTTDANGEVEYTRKTITVIADQAATSIVYFRSQPGDYIGQGIQQLVLTPNGAFSYGSVRPSFMRFYSNATSTGDSWSLDLAGSDGLPIHAGSYENALRASFSGAANGLDFYGAGRGCNMVTGRFDVLEVAYDASGNVLSVAVDFEQHCEGGTAALLGSFRYKSAVPLRP